MLIILRLVKVSWAEWGERAGYGRVSFVFVRPHWRALLLYPFVYKTKGNGKMKKFIKVTLALVLVLATILCFASCNSKGAAETLTSEETVAAEGLWKNATYRKNTTLGEGEKTVVIDVEMEGKSVAITIKTDKATLGEALFAEKLINDASFFDTLNGVKADWNARKLG